MSYALAACFAPTEVLRATVLPEGCHSRSIGFGLVLVDLSDATGGRDPRRHPLFLSLTAETAAWLSSLGTGPVAYAEAEYWAGIGST